MAKIEVGEIVSLKGFSPFDRGRKEDRAVSAIEIDPPVDFGSWRSDPFVRVAVEGVKGWFCANGDRYDQIPVGIGSPSFTRKPQPRRLPTPHLGD